MKLARLHHHANSEPYWHVYAAVILAIGLQLIPSSQLSVGPKYLIAGLEVLLLVALMVSSTSQHMSVRRARRALAIVFVAIISIVNLSSLALIINDILVAKQVSGQELLLSGVAVYLTNIIIYGIWYWELDNNGEQDDPAAARPTDFLFPQTSMPASALRNKRWGPTFFDYLYVSITNASAFSPTDTLPLTHRIKLLMTIQSLTSLLTVALVAARAVNILS